MWFNDLGRATDVLRVLRDALKMRQFVTLLAHTLQLQPTCESLGIQGWTDR